MVFGVKKVMILANSSGGLYDFRNEVVEALLTEYQVIVCVPDETKTELLRAEGCEVVMTPINRRGMNPVQDLSLYKQYRALLGQYHPDMVLTYTIKPNIYGGFACRMAKIPYITNITGLGTTFERGGMVQKLVTIMYRTALKKANCVFFQNSYNKSIFDTYGIHGKKTRIVPGSGVNLQKHRVEEYPDSDVTEFLFVGRVMKEKGIDEFLETAEQYADEHTKFSILGYCEEAYEEQIRQLSETGKIHFYGFDTQVHEYLKNASVVVVPSYHEGMSNVVLEASATGRPILASNINGCKEAVSDGETGFLFQPRSSEALKNAVAGFLQLSHNDRSVMGKMARQKMETEFDRQIVVDAYLEEIRG